jgi:hypothetical protein
LVTDVFQRCQQAAGLVAGADGDADAAGRFVAAVAHQDRLSAQAVAYFQGALAEMAEDEIRRTRDVRDA